MKNYFELVPSSAKQYRLIPDRDDYYRLIVDQSKHYDLILAKAPQYTLIQKRRGMSAGLARRDRQQGRQKSSKTQQATEVSKSVVDQLSAIFVRFLLQLKQCGVRIRAQKS